MFFDNFDMYCKKMGKTNSEVTRAIGLDPSSCSGWRKGAVPRNGTLRKLADYFGVSIEDLTGEKEKPAGNGGPKDEEMIKLLAEWEMLPEEDKVKSKVYFKGMLDMLKKGDNDGTQ